MSSFAKLILLTFFSFFFQEDAVKSEDVPLEILRRSLPLSRTREEAADIASKIIMLERVSIHLKSSGEFSGGICKLLISRPGHKVIKLF